jgi:hypothetical protein
MGKNSQSFNILRWLCDGNPLTALQALKKFDCFRLSARIREIKEEGYPIVKEMITTKNGKRVAQYRIV